MSSRQPRRWCTAFEKLGTIRTTSELVASSGGDKQLYFKHPVAK